MSASPAEPLPGQVIGARYEVIDSLGSGGMARVLRVRDRRSDVERALKWLQAPTDDAAGSAMRWQFEREFHTLAQLSHPGIVRVFDYGLHDGRPFYTMEVLDGADLVELGRLPWQRACRIAHGVASALAVLHSRRLVHRDVSTRNVRLSPDGAATLLDFGAMVPMGHCQDVIGTPPFVAPEALFGQSLDGRIDLYSVGACLYWMLTGQHAFAAKHFRDLQLAWGHAPAPPSELNPDVPPRLDELVLSLLAHRPAARPPNAGVLMNQLHALAGGPGGSAIHNDNGVASQSDEASRAHLVNPPLVGRDDELARFRTRLEETLSGRGQQLCLRGDTGVGRSRLLDACMLEAQLLGATAVRGSAATFGTGRRGMFATLTAQLAHRRPTRGKAEPKGDAGLSQLLQAVDQGPLVVAIDDLEQADLPTLEGLCALSDACESRPLLLLLALSHETSEAEQALASDRQHKREALQQSLLARAQFLELSPLGADDSETLLRSVFGDVPHLKLLANRLQKVAQGRPRVLLELSQHMIDRGVIRYDSGEWILPARLGQKDVPRKPRELDLERLRDLSRDASMLARVLALRPDGSFELDELLSMTGERDAGRLFDGLDELMRAGVIELRDTRCAFVRPQWASAFSAGLGESLKHGHARLATLTLERCADDDPARLTAAGHFLCAGDSDRALQVAAAFAEAAAAPWLGTTCPDTAPQPLPERVMESLEELFALASRRERPLPERLDMLAALVVAGRRSGRVVRYAPALLRHLQRDTGLAACAELLAKERAGREPPRTEEARLRRALRDTERAHGRALSMDRGLPQATAQAWLGPVYVRSLQAIAVDWSAALAEACPDTAPLGPDFPLAGALADSRHAERALLAGDLGQALVALRRVWAQVEAWDGDGVAPWQHALRHRTLVRLGTVEAMLGMTSALHRIAALGATPAHPRSALLVERLHWLARGDGGRAEQLRRRADLHTLHEDHQTDEDLSMLGAAAWLSSRLGDISELKRLGDALRRRAVDNPAARALGALCTAALSQHSGDLEAATFGYAEALGDVGAARGEPAPKGDALRHNPTWRAAVEGLCVTWLARDRIETAARLVDTYAEATATSGIGAGAWAELRAMIAERAGDHAAVLQQCSLGLQACERWERSGEYVGNLHALRARSAAALDRMDETALAVADCARHWDRGENSLLGLRYQRLLDSLGDTMPAQDGPTPSRTTTRPPRSTVRPPGKHRRGRQRPSMRPTTGHPAGPPHATHGSAAPIARRTTRPPLRAPLTGRKRRRDN